MDIGYGVDPELRAAMDKADSEKAAKKATFRGLDGQSFTPSFGYMRVRQVREERLIELTDEEAADSQWVVEAIGSFQYPIGQAGQLVHAPFGVGDTVLIRPNVVPFRLVDSADGALRLIVEMGGVFAFVSEDSDDNG